MPKTAPISLEGRITAALTDVNNGLWFPHLTYDLVRTGWQRLEEETGIGESDYGTARVILNDVSEVRDIAFSLLIPNHPKGIKNIIPIEILPKIITDQYKESGVNFYTSEELFDKGFTNNEVLNCVRDAFNVISRVPSLFSTVILLVKSIHLIMPESDDYDVSFSEPNIPFSIFISVPPEYSETNALRVAEAIVHEAMHLQLTLIERILKLISACDEIYYSPWKKEYRTPRGILHGIYVFRAIYDFLTTTLLVQDNLSDDIVIHIQSRILEIDEQIMTTNSFEKCSTLTKLGSNFVNRLVLLRK